MFSFKRATGFAVTSLLVATSAMNAGPSLAKDGGSMEIPSFNFDLESENPENAISAVAGTADTDLENPDAVAVVAADSRSLSELVAAYADMDLVDEEHECLAGAVYYESKGEKLEGQLAVAEVVINRAKSGRFPASICGVVKQKSQFSFVRGGHIPAAPKASVAWRKAVAISYIAKQNLDESGVGEAMYFHARYVSPKWRRTRVASIGNHVFYR